ncbi:hypothetical protein [Rubripirellula reticaptiva]|uniref:Uncharacterized protein n=1 Tax=Rubripirellula reticaptiva TaxID=2528013 RepID=A0A5C6EGJ5_9BACT|nr:hypothetical protein [Rubripirellula reticaptiva]TWU47928.1 hypothetical protein Poly59_47720 [Rubripirellula reticaptiva]
MSDPQNTSLPVGSQPADVPSFGCIVYVRANPAGGVIARVANLDGIEIAGSTERDVLSRIVPQFKKKIQDHMAADKPIPWTEPPAAMTEGEQKRFLPMHL